MDKNQDEPITLEYAEAGTDSPQNNEHNVAVLGCLTKNLKAVTYCYGLSVGPIVYGFDSIIVTLVVAMPAFQQNFGELYHGAYIIPAMWLSLWTSMISVGVMVGSLVAGLVSDRFGRRMAVILGALMTIAGALVCYFSDHVAALESRRVTFLMGKIVIGAGLGLLLPASQTYVSEVSPLRIRGPLLSLFSLFVILGQVIAISGLNARITILSAASYRVLFLVEIAPAAFCVICAIVAPESPTHYLRQKNTTAASKAYARLYSSKEVDSGIRALKAALADERDMQSNSKDAKWTECFRGTNWRRTRIVFHANVLQQFVGIAMIVNATYFMQMGGLSPTNSITVTTIALCLSMVGLIISWFTMTRYGRRKPLLGSTGIIALLWMAIGIAGCFTGSKALWAVGAGIVVVQFVYGLGVGSIYPVVASETSTMRLRAKTQSLGFFVQFLFNWAFNYAVPYMYTADQGDLGGKVGFIFSGLSAAALVVLFLEVPEMKDRTYAELDELFERNTPTRRF